MKTQKKITDDKIPGMHIGFYNLVKKSLTKPLFLQFRAVKPFF